MIPFKDLRIVFMGTPDFAVASLAKLVENGCTIAGVITAPDKPGGRGMELQQSAVKKFALEKNLLLLQPEKLKSPEFLEELRSLKADLQCVVAFRMLPEIVWNMPRLGTVNVHGSLLPQYRGAAPINWAIINGEKQTGVTTFKLRHEIDTGDILLREKIDIKEEDTAGSLHDHMKEIGADLLLKTVEGIAAGSLIAVKQEIEAGEKHAPKLNNGNIEIDWRKTGKEVNNLVRGLSPYPAAFSWLGGKKLKVFAGAFIEESKSTEPGISSTDNKTYLAFTVADGRYEITDLQLEGKKRMYIKDFLRGYRA